MKVFLLKKEFKNNFNHYVPPVILLAFGLLGLIFVLICNPIFLNNALNVDKEMQKSELIINQYTATCSKVEVCEDGTRKVSFETTETNFFKTIEDPSEKYTLGNVYFVSNYFLKNSSDLYPYANELEITSEPITLTQQKMSDMKSSLAKTTCKKKYEERLLIAPVFSILFIIMLSIGMAYVVSEVKYSLRVKG